jgi:drug/metabolite transporter (DMT)-like permease
MSTSIAEQPKTAGASAPRQSSARTKILVFVAFAAVYLVWGSTYLAIRVGIESFPPFVLAGVRHLIAGIVLYAVFQRKTGIRPTKAHWWTAGVTGFMLLFVGNGGVSWAEQTVPSGIAALLVATVSLWLVIFDWLRPGGIRPVARVTAGLLMGFGGLVLLVGPAHLGGAERVEPRGAAVLMIASLAWAWGSLYSKHRDKPTAPMLNAGMQSFAGGVALLIAAVLTGEFHGFHFAAVSARSWLALVYLIVFGSGIGFSAYVFLLEKSTPARVGTYAFVNPVVALFLGWLILAEPLSLRTFLAAGVILTAVILVITAPHPDPVRAKEPLAAPGEA